MKLITIVGARPQFIKAAPVSHALAAAGITELLVHTGQHFDPDMSDVFFHELAIPAPAYHLGVAGGRHGGATGRMLEKIEETLETEKPDWVLIYGDTNSTLAGALAAAKLHIPVAHVEAGLRSFNRKMPEEVNRVLADHVSALLFAPTQTAVDNLKDEGIKKGVHKVGDVMYDATLNAADQARAQSRIIDELGLKPKGYSVATLHRAESTDKAETLAELLDFLRASGGGKPVVFPLHPRTRKAVDAMGLSLKGLKVIPPVGYLDMNRLLMDASGVFTDSGGLQKEAYFHGVPCVTLRSETEWVETIENGWNRLWKGADFKPRKPITEYGDGKASVRIASIIAKA